MFWSRGLVPRGGIAVNRISPGFLRISGFMADPDTNKNTNSRSD